MSYYNEVFGALMDNYNDKTLYARRQSWDESKQVRVMKGKLYGIHMAIFDKNEEGAIRAMPFIPTTRQLTASDWEIGNGMELQELIAIAIGEYEEYIAKKKAQKMMERVNWHKQQEPITDEEVLSQPVPKPERNLREPRFPTSEVD